MKATLVFPGKSYSTNKKQIAKLRKDVDCTEWSGSSWEGPDLLIETAFMRQAEILGIPHEYDGDVLWLTGAEEVCVPFIELCKSVGGKAEVENEESNGVNWANIDNAEAAVKIFEARAEAYGMNEVFIEKWSAMIVKNAASGGAIVT